MAGDLGGELGVERLTKETGTLETRANVPPEESKGSQTLDIGLCNLIVDVA